jgi:hypothetical protein
VPRDALPQEVRVLDERRPDVVPRGAPAEDEVMEAGEELERRPPVGVVAEDRIDARVVRELARDPGIERRTELEPARPPQQ